jgi:hypothetical protein
MVSFQPLSSGLSLSFIFLKATMDDQCMFFVILSGCIAPVCGSAERWMRPRPSIAAVSLAWHYVIRFSTIEPCLTQMGCGMVVPFEQHLPVAAPVLIAF